MSGDQPAHRLTRWICVIAGVAALLGIVYGFNSRAQVAQMPRADESEFAPARLASDMGRRLPAAPALANPSAG